MADATSGAGLERVVDEFPDEGLLAEDMPDEPDEPMEEAGRIEPQNPRLLQETQPRVESSHGFEPEQPRIPLHNRVERISLAEKHAVIQVTRQQWEEQRSEVQRLSNELAALQHQINYVHTLVSLLPQGSSAVPAKCSANAPDKFKEGGKTSIFDWLEAMEIYLQAGGANPQRRVEIAATYLEPKVLKQWLLAARGLEARGESVADWDKFRAAMIRAFGNVNLEQSARAKLRTLTQTGTVEEFANEFQNLCAQITEMPLSEGDKIERFTQGLRHEIQILVAIDPQNDGQPWKNFARLVQFAVSLDATRTQAKGQTTLQVSGSRPFASSKRLGKPIQTSGGFGKGQPSRVGGPMRTKNLAKVKNDHGSDYKRVARLKREGRCYTCEEEGHMSINCPKKKQVEGKGKEPAKDF